MIKHRENKCKETAVETERSEERSVTESREKKTHPEEEREGCEITAEKDREKHEREELKWY